MGDADSLVGGRYGTLKIQLLLSPKYEMVRAATVAQRSSGNVGGGLGVSLVAVALCGVSLLCLGVVQASVGGADCNFYFFETARATQTKSRPWALSP